MAEIIVTGGYGFIGTHLLKHLLEQTDYKITNIDSETYAAQKQHIQGYIRDNPQYRRRIKFIKKDISNYKQLEKIFESIKPKGVINVAAESHVDNSITGPLPFITSNIVGTFNLLECSRKFDVERYLQVSTDEVYGQLLNHDDHPFTEINNLEPSSVYSSSKASADLLVQSYYRTFKLNTCITRCCNNYGPYQHKEKLLPKTILNALNNHTIPVYGKGENVREWIHAEDHSRAVLAVFNRGRPGEVYNIGTGETYNNITLVKMILSLVDRKEDLIEFVEDRKGHDFKYAIDCGKITNKLGWSPEITFENGIKQTIDWYRSYLDNILPC
jgi:dTDP-glucose 4,6-dehydratase